MALPATHLPADAIAAVLEQASGRLRAISPTPRLDAEVLLAYVLGTSRSQLHVWPERPIPAARLGHLEALIARRCQGEPVAYLTGQREFWSMSLQVTTATLIPRPETELLVETALACVPPRACWRIADLGTGSGAIALALARERPGCRIIATDLSAAALEVARSNAEHHGLGNIEFRVGDWLAPLGDERYELVVSNPPYVAADDPCLMAGGTRFEPRTALASGVDGMDALRHLIGRAPPYLTAAGRLMVEHGCDQGPAVAALLSAHGYAHIRSHRDLAGHERVSEGRHMP
jgi:release factor glutamine methyltransferase